MSASQGSCEYNWGNAGEERSGVSHHHGFHHQWSLLTRCEQDMEQDVNASCEKTGDSLILIPQDYKEYNNPWASSIVYLPVPLAQHTCVVPVTAVGFMLDTKVQ